MKLHNTSTFPDPLVREVYQFVKPSGILPRDVIVRDGHEWGVYSGHSSQGSRVVVTVSGKEPLRTNWQRTVLRRQRLKAASRPTAGQGYLDFVLLSPEEGLVSVLAHEARHQWQGLGIATKWGGVQTEIVERTRIVHDRPGEIVRTKRGIYYDARRVTRPHVRVKRRRMVWGARGRYSERDADAYAIRMVRAWRRSRRSESVGFQPLDAPFERYVRFPVETFGTEGTIVIELVKDRLTGKIERAQ